MLDIDALLKKNPDVKEVFERNQAILENLPPVKKHGYRIGLPYGARQPVTEQQDSDPMPRSRHIK